LQQFEDRLSKYLVSGLFAPWTDLEVGVELLPDPFRADILIIPQQPLPLDIPGAGLISRLTGDARCLVEAFSGTVHEELFEANLVKLRLALQRAHRDKKGQPYPHGVLWLIFNYWPQQAIRSIFADDGHELEPGLLRFPLLPRGTVYLVNTTKIAFREETLLFWLLGKGKQRKAAMATIFQQRIEPYMTLLNHFDRRLQQMTQSQLQHLDPEQLQDLFELKDTRQEVLMELGHKQGELDARKQVARKLLAKGLSIQEVADLTDLSVEILAPLLSEPNP